jgi:hypothetical protein
VIFVKYSLNDQAEDDMGRACSTTAGIHIGYWWKCGEERDHSGDKEAGSWIILKRILE